MQTQAARRRLHPEVGDYDPEGWKRRAESHQTWEFSRDKNASLLFNCQPV